MFFVDNIKCTAISLFFVSLREKLLLNVINFFVGNKPLQFKFFLLKYYVSTPQPSPTRVTSTQITHLWTLQTNH